MKKCQYCGRHNADEVEKCQGCGEAGFAAITPQPVSEQETRNRKRRLIFRLLVALCMWLAVSGISLYVAWGDAFEASEAKSKQRLTQRQLRQVNQAIMDYQKKFGALPLSLNEIRASSFVDGWGRDFVYSVDGTNGFVTSYGRDGKPGGRGLDCDLTTKNWSPKESLPTFRQVLHNVPSGGLIGSCLMFGGLAFLLSFFTVKEPDLTKSGLTALGVKLVVTLIGAWIVASIIGVLHILPKNH